MHKGHYWFLYMPFSLKMSQDVFQMKMDQITDRLPVIIAIHDAIYVYGKDTAENERNLLQLMQTATQQGLVFSSSKCAICQSQISFYGAIFTVQGMKPDHAKVQAWQDLPAPENSKQLQSFLGLIKYLQAFLPSLTSKTTFFQGGSSKLGWELLHRSSFSLLGSPGFATCFSGPIWLIVTTPSPLSCRLMPVNMALALPSSRPTSL